MKPNKSLIRLLFILILIIGVSKNSIKTHAEENNDSTALMPISQNQPNTLPTSVSLVDNIRLVGNWQDLTQALNDNSISYIKFKNNITDAPDSQVTVLGDSSNSKIRNLTIDGNGCSLNLKNSYFQYPSQTLNNSQIIKINFTNLTVYQTAAYGLIECSSVSTKYNVANAGQLIFSYSNFNYTGSQMLYALYTDIVFTGLNNKINIVPNYIYGGINYATSPQEAIEAASVTVDNDSNLQANNSAYALFNLYSRGDFTIGDNAIVNLTSTSNASLINAANNFKVGKQSHANFTFNSDSPGSAVNLSGSSSPTVLVQDSANVTITTMGATTSNALIDFSATNNSSFILKDYAQVNTVFNKGLSSSAYALAMRGTNNTVNFSPNSKFNIKSTFSTLANGGYSHLLDLGPYTTFNMESKSSLAMNINDTGGGAMGIYFNNNSTFNVEKDATVDLKLGFIGTGSYALYFESSGSLKVNSAKLFNLEFTCQNPSDSGVILRMTSDNRGLLFNNQDITANRNSRGRFPTQDFGQYNWYNIERLSIPQQSVASQGISVTETSASHSATEVKTLNNRVASSILNGFFFYNFKSFKLTQPTTTNTDNSANVSNWQELNNAMFNQSITLINIVQDITYNEGNTALEINREYPKRSLAIDGQNHYVDFRGISFYNNDDIAPNVILGLEINNLKMFGQNFYGPFKFTGATSPKSASNRSNGYGYIRYNDSDYFGPQLTASYTYDIIFAGKVNNNSLYNSYVSPSDNISYPVQGGGQVNIEATNIIFEEKATYNGSAENAGVFALASGGGITLGTDSIVNLKSIDNGTSSGEYGGYVLYLGGEIYCHHNSKLNIYTRSNVPQTAIYVTSGSKSLRLDQSSDLSIYLNDSQSSGYIGSPVISIDSALVNISQYASLNLLGSIKRNSSLVYLTGTSQLQIDNMGSLTAKLTGDAQNLSVLQVPGSGKVRFSSAKLVDIDLSQIPNTNNNLFYISGSLEAYNQKIEGWKKASTSISPDYTWNSIYSLVAPYSGATVGNPVNVASNSQSVISDFLNNYHTENFNHLVFRGYPELSLTTDYLTNDTSDKNSYTIQGNTEPNALVRFSGDSSIPLPTISSYNLSDQNTKFHTVADANGHFEFQLPTGKYFIAGNIVTSTAFSKDSGKKTAISQKVLTKQEIPKDSDYLKLISVPDLNFGTYPINSQSKTLKTVKNQTLTVEGLSQKQSSWKVTFKITPIKTSDDVELPAQYQFGDTLITPNSEEIIYRSPSIDAKQYQTNFSPDEGFKLIVNLSQVQAKEYSGQATWSIVVGP